MPTRCAVYARYSSDQQRPESIADQVRHCRQEAGRHPDWVVLDEHVYTDEAVSGLSVEDREGLQRLVHAALRTPRPFDVILVDDTSRLSRDVVDTVQQFRELADRLQQRGYTTGRIEKILGRNFLRYAQDIWEVPRAPIDT